MGTVASLHTGSYTAPSNPSLRSGAEGAEEAVAGDPGPAQRPTGTRPGGGANVWLARWG